MSHVSLTATELNDIDVFSTYTMPVLKPFFLTCFLASLLLNATSTWAQKSAETVAVNPVVGVLVVEALIVTNAYMASQSPAGYGALLTLLSPMGASGSASDTTNYVAIGSAATIGLYNALELSDGSYSEGEIVKQNLIAWHAFAASVWLSETLTGDTDTVAAIAPFHDGAMVAIHHSF